MLFHEFALGYGSLLFVQVKWSLQSTRPPPTGHLRGTTYLAAFFVVEKDRFHRQVLE